MPSPESLDSQSGELPLALTAPQPLSAGNGYSFPGLETRTVLIVEDAEPVREVLRLVLETAGYQVLLAATGGEGIHLAEQLRQPIDLLIADLVLPDMEGQEAAEVLCGLRSGLKVLFISGLLPRPENFQDQRGAAYLPKPFTPEKLLKAIDHLLGSCPRPLFCSIS